MAKEEWILLRRDGAFFDIAEKFGIDPVVARVLVNRGIKTDKDIETYLHGDVHSLYDPATLTGAPEAAKKLKDCITQRKTIRIIGDYDIDGVFATYILYEVIQSLGGQVDYDIPDRVKDGYGLNMNLIKKASHDHVDVILTCDNGISAHAQIHEAKHLGMEVILTDHHQPLWREADGLRTDDLPEADVIVDPHVQDETYPFPQICGAVVAWKVMQLLLRLYGREEDYLQYIAYAAFATIGDVMPLQDENRIIVKYGLEQLTHTSNRGLRTLIEHTGILHNHDTIKPSHVGYILGPCINAAGRLDTAMKSLKMLTARNTLLADMMAGELAEYNADRQEMTDRGEEEAYALLEKPPHNMDKVLVLYIPSCSERIMGIVAGRVREWTGKPAFILTDAEQPGLLKGSGRSIPAYQMHDALVRVADLLEVFGGHALAAGLTMRKENLELLRERLNASCGLTDEDLITRIEIDVPMPVSYLLTHQGVIDDLDRLEPCGQGNRGAMFAQADLQVHGIRILGKRANVMKFSFLTPEGYHATGILFGRSDLLEEQLSDMFGREVVRETLSGRYAGMNMDILYVPEFNEFRGEKTVQLSVRHFRKAKRKA